MSPPLAITPLVQNMIPEEILSEIFMLCLNSNKHRRILRSRAPLNVSHVCRSWRHAALSTRTLWDGMCVNVYGFGPTLQEWFSRSVRGPINIHIECCQTERNPKTYTLSHIHREPLEVIEALFREVAQLSDRLSLLHVTAHSGDLDDISECMRENLSTLRNLEILIYSMGPGGLDPGGISKIAEHFSDLSYLSLGINQPSSSIVGSFELEMPLCAKLRSLCLDVYINPAVLILALEKCPVVEKVVVHMRTTPLMDSENLLLRQESIVPLIRKFESIRSFTISMHGGQVGLIDSILEASEMPSLSHLEIVGDFHNMVMNCRMSEPINDCLLEDFLVRSRPPLEILRVEHIRMNSVTIKRWLKLCPLLRSLSIYVTLQTARLVLTLPSRIDDDDQLVCPLLEDLDVLLDPLHGSYTPVHWAAMEAMVRSRWSPSRDRKIGLDSSSSTPNNCVPKVLRTVCLRSVYLKGHPLQKALQDCIDQGFELQSGVFNLTDGKF